MKDIIIILMGCFVSGFLGFIAGYKVRRMDEIKEKDE